MEFQLVKSLECSWNLCNYMRIPVGEVVNYCRWVKHNDINLVMKMASQFNSYPNACKCQVEVKECE